MYVQTHGANIVMIWKKNKQAEEPVGPHIGSI